MVDSLSFDIPKQQGVRPISTYAPTSLYPGIGSVPDLWGYINFSNYTAIFHLALHSKGSWHFEK